MLYTRIKQSYVIASKTTCISFCATNIEYKCQIINCKSRENRIYIFGYIPQVKFVQICHDDAENRFSTKITPFLKRWQAMQ